jgi:hypothetical protein
MGRSILAVAAGYVGMILVVLAGTAIATIAFVPGGLAAAARSTPVTLPASYLAANLAVSFGGAAAGAWIVCRLARSSKRGHVLAFLGLLAVMGIVSARALPPDSGQPAWYPWVIPVIGLAGAASGGWRALAHRESHDVA